MEKSSEERGIWGSKIGFILAAAGSAIGLGNIWRFPYVVGENGGAAFVLIYIILVYTIGFPVMIAELTIGRNTRKNPIGAFEKLAPGTLWKYVGALGVITGIFILSFYGVIAGWVFGYIFKTMSGSFTGLASPAEAQQIFEEFCGNPLISVGFLLIFICITSFVIYKGVKSGIERWAKILMPALLILLILLIIRSITLPGASEGLKYYLVPDFSKINYKTVLQALGQAFFSLSLGMGTMITYGSYISKKDNLATSAFYVCTFDTFIAIIAGFIFIPALFAMNMSPNQGPTLIFQVLPSILDKIPGGQLFGTGLFLLISIAALTSTISLLEVPVSYVVDEKNWSRKKAVLIMGSAAFLFGIPSALSAGAINILSVIPLIKKSFLDLMSIIFGDFSLSIGSFFIATFLAWKWGTKNALNEIEQEKVTFKIKGAWTVFIKFICPVAIFIIFLNSIIILFI